MPTQDERLSKRFFFLVGALLIAFSKRDHFGNLNSMPRRRLVGTSAAERLEVSEFLQRHGFTHVWSRRDSEGYHTISLEPCDPIDLAKELGYVDLITLLWKVRAETPPPPKVHASPTAAKSHAVKSHEQRPGGLKKLLRAESAESSLSTSVGSDSCDVLDMMSKMMVLENQPLCSEWL